MPAGATLRDAEQSIGEGRTLRQQGRLSQSIELLTEAFAASEDGATRVRIGGELGLSLLQAGRHDLAATHLRQAHAALAGKARALQALRLGHVWSIRRNDDAARQLYEEALALAGGDAQIELAALTQLARMSGEDERLVRLQELGRRIGLRLDGAPAARLHLNVGLQAHRLGEPGTALAVQQIAQARSLAQRAGDTRVLIEAEEAWSQLLEDQGRAGDALAAIAVAVRRAGLARGVVLDDLLIDLRWRQGRLQLARGQPKRALDAYARAIAHVRAIRQDMPIEYEDGRSSYRHTLEPVYLGYADLLLQSADGLPSAAMGQRLRLALDALEEMKQAELQDFLGDRCAVEALQGSAPADMPAGTAALYPVLFADRVELLLKTHTGISRHVSRVGSDAVLAAAQQLAGALRGGSENFLAASTRLHGWLLGPLEAELARSGIHSLVVVSDGALRLLPFAALHDGTAFAVQKYAVSTVTGLSITNTQPPRSRNIEALVVGVSEPGPVVEKLGQRAAGQVLLAAVTGAAGAGEAGLGRGRTVRSLGMARGLARRDAAAEPRATREQLDELRSRLALPGVKAEVEAVGAILAGRELLNGAFTVDRFSQEAETGFYRILHIASHGVFGGSAETSFIMAYDDILTIDGLQTILRSQRLARAPIELLSLSACETAEGNERAPLGISGAAIKARAKSVLGTLWPVDDLAAQTLMRDFYGGLVQGRLSKTEALRQAQLGLLADPQTAHPLFWAPFVIVGNWQ